MNISNNHIEIEEVGTARRAVRAVSRPRTPTARRPYRWLAVAAWGVCAAASAQTTVTHAELQAVKEDGTSDWTETFPFTIQGVILNDPEEMLDVTYDPDAAAEGRKGGEYQVFFQGVNGDRGGTALWMAQNYEALGGWIPVGNDYGGEWTNEMNRIRHDAAGRTFRKGDLIEVTARKALFFNGKRNINEAHRIDPANDFDIALVQANAGLPLAEPITLADLMDTDGNFYFDETRATGGEHWQGMRVRLDGVRMVDAGGWGESLWADRLCAVEDIDGRSFPLRMPRTDLGDPPGTSRWFSAIGILNQESHDPLGYELFVQEIGPVLHVGPGPSGGVAVHFTTDYEGYVLEATDDMGGGEWSPVDITPVRVILMEDFSDSPNRMYRLRKVD